MSKISSEDKIHAVNLYLNGIIKSKKRIASMFGVSVSTVEQWIFNYESMGEEAFLRKSNKHYSKELKEQAISDYLSGKGSLDKICKIYGIRARSRLQLWVKSYNSHEKLNASRTGGTVIMTKGRKTTFDERVDIASYCIEHDHNYKETAAKFEVSYQQARSYTVKYEKNGMDGLQDRRGKRRSGDSLTELEKLRAELKLEKAKRKQAEMEASFLKKLDEIERRRG